MEKRRDPEVSSDDEDDPVVRVRDPVELLSLSPVLSSIVPVVRALVSEFSLYSSAYFRVCILSTVHFYNMSE